MQKYDQVVLLSFSTYTNDGILPPKIYSAFVQFFKKFPKIGFIWRQKEELESVPPNVLLISWINQRAFNCELIEFENEVGLILTNLSSSQSQSLDNSLRSQQCPGRCESWDSNDWYVNFVFVSRNQWRLSCRRPNFG